MVNIWWEISITKNLVLDCRQTPLLCHLLVSETFTIKSKLTNQTKFEQNTHWRKIEQILKNLVRLLSALPFRSRRPMSDIWYLLPYSKTLRHVFLSFWHAKIWHNYAHRQVLRTHFQNIKKLFILQSQQQAWEMSIFLYTDILGE